MAKIFNKPGNQLEQPKVILGTKRGGNVKLKTASKRYCIFIYRLDTEVTNADIE